MIYLDTNVYNAIIDHTHGTAALQALEKSVAASGIEIALSPVNIVEVMATPDVARRERLVLLMQHICGPRLLAEPESLIVDFIAARTNDKRLVSLALLDPFCVTQLQETWSDVRGNKAKTFVVQPSAIRFVSILKDVTGLFHAVVSRHGTMVDTGLDLRLAESEEIPKAIKERTREMRRRPVSSKPPSASVCAAFFSTMVLCARLTLFPDAVDRMWSLLGISDSESRIRHTFNELSFLHSEGSFIGMGALAARQSRHGYQPSNLMDCFHISYLPYVTRFLTLDESILRFARKFPHSKVLSRIQSASPWLNAFSHSARR